MATLNNKKTGSTLESEAQEAGNMEHVPYGYGYYYSPLQDYMQGQLNRTEVFVFEYLLMIGEYFLRDEYPQFWHSYNTIHKRTGVSMSTIKKVVAKFKSLGFMTTKIKQNARALNVTYFEINYLNIIKGLPILFGDYNVKREPGQRDRLRARKLALLQMHKLRSSLKRANRF